MVYSKSSRANCFPWACSQWEEEAHTLQGIRLLYVGSWAYVALELAHLTNLYNGLGGGRIQLEQGISDKLPKAWNAIYIIHKNSLEMD